MALLSSSLDQQKSLSIFLGLSQYPLAKCKVRLSRLYLQCVLCTLRLGFWQTSREREFQRESVGMFCPSRCLNQTIKALQAVVSY